MTTEPYTPDAARWDAFVGWAGRFYEWEGFDKAERNYKIEYGKRLAEAKDAFLAGNEKWSTTLRRAITARGVPHSRFASIRFVELLNSQPAMVDEALRHVWAGAENVSEESRERVRGFIESLADAPSDQRIGQPENLASFLPTAHDATQHPYYQVTPFSRACALTGYPTFVPDAPRWERYAHGVEFLDEFISQAAIRNLEISHRLDAQSLVWCVTKTTPEEWDTETLAGLAAYRGSDPEPKELPKGPPQQTPNAPDWPDLAAKLVWEPHDLEEIVADLEDKKQMIFYGPPGTGKTFVAKAIAAEYAKAGGGFEVVQFHPSYSYEDFVEGFRPRLTDAGQAGFDLKDGPLKRIAEAASKKALTDPSAKFVLVIDELNRGNVAKVFGELYFLLEYRREAMTLQYSDEPFELPENLLFICTMNTADRSIALVDAALRRRFWFQGFFSDEPPIQGLLRRWLARKQPQARWVADLVDRANEHLNDRDAAIGPSYFMGDAELDDERVQRIWRRAVRPYVEEQCYGEDEKLRSLEYDRLRSEVNAGTPLPAEAAAGTSEEADAGGDDAS